ncbi:MAG: hypothetical protein WA418_37530 [Bradyrhizobium sp.]
MAVTEHGHDHEERGKATRGHAVVERLTICPTGNSRMPGMRQLPVVPVCRKLITCTVGQITSTFSRIPAR